MKFSTPLKFYLIRNHQNKYFRAVGYCGYGVNWVEDITKAKVYQKLSQARSRVTYFADLDKGITPPVIIEIIATEGTVLDETARLEKAVKSKAKKAEAQRIKNEAYRKRVW
jgi:hypothetical protein